MNLKNLNLKYALVNIGYMLLVSGSLGFAYNYLSQSGFDDGTIGTVMSLVNLCGVFLGPAAADVVDRSERITQKMFITASMVVCCAFAAILLVVPQGSFLILPIVIIAFMCSTIGMPLLNGMAFIYEKAGGIINYGLCRGLGSAAYAVGSNVVGRLWAGFGRNTLPLWIIAAAILTLVAVQFMPAAPKQSDEAAPEDKEESISILQFFGKYKSVTVVVVSLVLMYYCHFLLQNFMAKIIGTFATSGVEQIQGNALFIQAMVELPTMFGFALLMKRFDIPKILVVASVFYSIKHVIVLLCGSVPMFYAAMVLQMVSYAALVPAVVYYSNQQIGEADKNKGQAVFSTTASVGALLASFVGGWMFQFLDVRLVVAVGVASSIAGTVLMFLGTRGAKKAGRTATVRM
ncbi:MAG: MFS transporter [Coriobacteriales bacterium]|nr:MFS transporter [Coriobacteriales bacterium]